MRGFSVFCVDVRRCAMWKLLLFCQFFYGGLEDKEKGARNAEDRFKLATLYDVHWQFGHQDGVRCGEAWGDGQGVHGDLIAAMLRNGRIRSMHKSTSSIRGVIRQGSVRAPTLWLKMVKLPTVVSGKVVDRTRPGTMVRRVEKIKTTICAANCRPTTSGL